MTEEKTTTNELVAEIDEEVNFTVENQQAINAQQTIYNPDLIGIDPDIEKNNIDDSEPAEDEDEAARTSKRKWALVWGVNKYGNGADLAGCVRDAKRVTNFLRKLGYYVRLLLDEKATKANIISEYKRFVAAAQAGHIDEIGRFNSSHGSQTVDRDGDEPDGYDEVQCPCDTFDGQTISDDEIYTLDSQLPEGFYHWNISDCCHSGTNTRALDGLPKLRFISPSLIFGEKHASKIAKFSTKKERIILGVNLSACTSGSYSYDAVEDGLACGAFTVRLLKNWRTGMTWKNFIAALGQQLPSNEYPMTPQLEGPSEGLSRRMFG